MKIFKMLGIFILSLNTSLVFAQKGEGYGMGNGGDAVVCYTDATRSTITSVQMFDYWEQEQVVKYGKVDLGAQNLSVQEKIQIAVDRINKFDPELAEKIKFQALNLANNIQSYLVTSYQLPEIDDMTPQVVPTKPNCFIEQYGVQYKDVITGQRRFYIADKFYNFSGTSNDDKAGLLLHEAIYRYAILQRPSLDNSDGVRYFNYVVGSAKIATMSLDDIDDYVGFLRNAGVENVNCVKKNGLYIAEQIKLDKTKSTCEGFEVPYLNTSNPNEIKAKPYTTDVLCYSSKINVIQKTKLNLNQVVIHGGSCIDVSLNSKSGNISYVRALTPKQAKKSKVEISYYNEILAQTIVYSVNQINLEAGYPFTVSDLKISSLPITNFNFFKYQSAIPNSLIKFDDIAGQTQFCDVNSIVRVSYKGTVDVCNLDKKITANGFDYILGITFKTTDGFYIYNNKHAMFEILGSKKNLKVVPDIVDSNTAADWYYCSEMTLISNDMKLIRGCASENTLALGDDYIFNGFPRKIAGNFRVESDASGVYLSYRLNDVLFSSPKVKNLRVSFDGDGAYNAQENFCRTLGFSGTSGRYSMNKTDTVYVDGNSESFYNGSSGKIDYKTDENVNILLQVECSSSVRLKDYSY